MTNLKTNIIFWLSVCYAVFYTGLFWIAGYETTSFVLAALLFGLSLMVLITWGSTGVRAVLEGGREGEAILAFSICVMAAYGVLTRLWVVFKLSQDSPAWMNTSPIGLAPAVLLLVCFTGVLLAPETKGGNVPKKNAVFWALAIFIAGCFIGASIGVAISKDIPVSRISPMSAPISCDEPKPIAVRAYCRARPHRAITQ